MRGFPNLLLRIALAFAFLYPPINAYVDPNSWIGYFPHFMRFLPGVLLLHSFGVVEVVIALWILSGFKIFWPCLAAAALLIAIVGFNLPQFQVVFRDLSIAGMALSLALMNLPKRASKIELSV